MLDKWTTVEDGKRQFDFGNEKLEKLPSDEYKLIENALKPYKAELKERFSSKDAPFVIKDIAKRIKAGTGSLGSNRYYILSEGLTSSEDDDLILDMKEQGRPPLYRHMNDEEKKEYSKAYPDEGERHAHALEALAEHPDRHLGFVKMDDVSYSIKERSPLKCDFPSDKLKKKQQLYFTADAWGKILATRHKRTIYLLNSNPNEMPTKFQELISDKEEVFQKLVTSIAIQYADRVKGDYDIFLHMLADYNKGEG